MRPLQVQCKPPAKPVVLILANRRSSRGFFDGPPGVFVRPSSMEPERTGTLFPAMKQKDGVEKRSDAFEFGTFTV